MAFRFSRQVARRVERAGHEEAGSRQRRRGVAGRRRAGAQAATRVKSPALPTVKVNTRTAGTCGGLAQPRGTGRSWERREAATASVLSSGSGVREAGRQGAERWSSREGNGGCGCGCGDGGSCGSYASSPTCGSSTPAPPSAAAPRTAPRTAPCTAPRAPPQGRF